MITVILGGKLRAVVLELTKNCLKDPGKDEKAGKSDDDYNDVDCISIWLVITTNAEPGVNVDNALICVRKGSCNRWFNIGKEQ